MLDGIMRELERQQDYLQGAAVETIYFGGGTPSLLSADELNRIFDHIFKLYRVDQLLECTLEANPDDLTGQYLQSLTTTPVNRFSIGIQSFFDRDLAYMNRAHNARQSDYAIKAAQDKGFDRLSIDLIYGTPGLSDEDWLYNLQQVKALQISHFSAYALTVEEGTALHHAIHKKQQTPVDTEQSASQFELLMEQAPLMGFEHYEISNLAMPGQYALHNTNYWKGVPYLGIGPSAHSFDGRNRRYNVANNNRYLKHISERTEPYETELLTDMQRLNEYIMTSLRTMWGCSLQHISDHWGSATAAELKKESQIFLEKKWLSYKDDQLQLTNSGKLFADGIAADLFRTED